MAHQFSSAPPYGAQYAAPAYYPPFAPSQVQQFQNGRPGSQPSNNHHQNLQSPSSPSNTTRYDANAHVNLQPAPLPFGAHFNPELFKNFPIPPPPLPPNAHVGPPSANTAGFAHFPQGVNTPPYEFLQQQYSHFPQPPNHPGVGAAPSNLASVNEQRTYDQPLPVHESESFVDRDQVGKPVTLQYQEAETPAMNTSLAHSYDGIGRGLEQNTRSGQHAPDKSIAYASTSPQYDPRQRLDLSSQTASPATVEPRHLSKPVAATSNKIKASQCDQSEFRERAKAALLSLVPHNIRYEDFLAEGVNSQILQKMFDELGLNWQSRGVGSDATSTTIAGSESIKDRSTNTAQQSQTLTVAPVPIAPNGTSLAKTSPTATPLSQPSPVVGSGMERKDRIAQLLAAKAGKVVAPGAASKSQSPASATGPTQTQPSEREAGSTVPVVQPPKPARGLAQAEVVRQKMEQLKRETIARTLSEQSSTDIDRSTMINMQATADKILEQSPLSQSLATPVREKLVQSGLSSLIPGLFMTSADPEEANRPSLRLEDLVAANEQSIDLTANSSVEPIPNKMSSSMTISPESRKRSTAGDSVEEEYPEAKRQATYTEELLNMEGNADDDASEGEIVEDGEPSHAPQQAVTERPTKDYITYNFPNHDSGYGSKQKATGATRKRNARKEQRQNLKRGRDLDTRPHDSTSSALPIAVAPQSAVTGPPSTLLEQPVGNTKTDERMIQSPMSLTKATPEQIAERAARLKADFLRQRALRQKQLQEGIPVLNDEVAKTQARLKETKDKLFRVQAELQQFEANVLRVRQNEKELLQEIDRLSTQINEGESGQKNFSNELNNLKQESKGDANIQATPAPQPIQDPSHNSTRTIDDSLENQSKANQNQPVESSFEEEPQRAEHQSTSLENWEIDGAASQQASLGAEDSLSKKNVEPFIDDVGQDVQDVVDPTPVLDESTISNQKFEGSESWGTQQEEALAAANSDSDEAMDESDDESGDSHMSIDEGTDDSISMSDGESDDYEPAEPISSRELDAKADSDEYEPEIVDGQHFDAIAEKERSKGDEEYYEPAEGHRPMDEDYEPTDGVRPREIDEFNATPTFALNFADPNLIGAMGHFATEEPAYTVPQAAKTTETHRRADDQGRELQPSEANVLTQKPNMQSDETADESYVLGSAEPSSVRYVPYQSPLSSFKSYRFHPLFNEQVQDGYRSLTYSHKIDPKLPVCLTELGGVPCVDPECQDQHFGTMALTDDKILVQMSSASDIKDKGLREQYLIGLKKEIARLRQEGVKEFSAVANALSQYRREWTASQMNSE